MPTYGPSYVHLYTENNLYCGSLLIAIETEPLTALRQSGDIQTVICEKIPKIIHKVRIKEAFYMKVWHMCVTSLTQNKNWVVRYSKFK